MKRVILGTAVLLAAATAWAAEHVYYRIETSPSGSMIASDAPVLKGGTYLFHGYPSGTLVSLRRSDVRRITQITAAAAAGNPTASVVAIGNLAMQGGSVQGIGWALNEEYYMSSTGTMLNSSLLDYRMPTALDLPMIETIIVEVANPGHPFGARGVGEANIVPPPGALANAIYHAVGVRMNRLPMNPPAIMEAIWSQRD